MVGYVGSARGRGLEADYGLMHLPASAGFRGLEYPETVIGGRLLRGIN